MVDRSENDALLSPPANPAAPPQAIVDALFPHLASRSTYEPLPPPFLEPNEAGKVPAVESDPRMQGAVADIGNALTSAVPFGGPVAGGAKLAGGMLAGAMLPLMRASRRVLPEVEGVAVKGAHAYHSSPHDFERFDFSKIGSGQGAQSYGHGIYSAENPAVSGRGGQYWQEFADRFRGTPEGDAAEYLRRAGFDRDAAIALVNKDIVDVRANTAWHGPGTEAGIKQLEQRAKLLESGKPVGPRTYVVDINAKPETMINWDAAMRDQPAAFLNYPGAIDAARREAANRALFADSANRADALHLMSQDPLTAPGAFAYQNMAIQGAMKKGDRRRGTEALSRDLREADIPGIQYLDAGSRYRPSDMPPTHNFVKFDDNIDILRKLALIGGAVPTAGAMGFARQDNPQRGD